MNVKFKKMSTPTYPTVVFEKYVWIDLEMTGLDPLRDHIMEIAMIITDSNLNTILECEPIAIQLSKEVLDNMDPWCIEQHGKTGLTRECLESNRSLLQVQDWILDVLSKHVPKGAGVIAGNSVHFDKEFIRHHMPKVHDHLNYKILDVSTLKILSRTWCPNLPKYEKSYSHRALEDIKESIGELMYYRQHLFSIRC